MCDNMSLWTAVLVAFGDNMSANVRFYLVSGLFVWFKLHSLSIYYYICRSEKTQLINTTNKPKTNKTYEESN
jgi:hypothetical protein